MSSDVAPNSIACAACAFILPATLAMHQTPSPRSVLASAITFTKPSGSSMVLARLLAIIGNLPTLRSDEHTSELPSLMRSSYAVFRLTKQQLHARKLTHLNSTH